MVSLAPLSFISNLYGRDVLISAFLHINTCIVYCLQPEFDDSGQVESVIVGLITSWQRDY
jgi:hypothetical protein